MAPDATTTAERAGPKRPRPADAPFLPDLVGGKWVESRGTSHVDVFNPATGAVIAKTPLGTRADVDAAVAAAKAAFPAWRATPVVERARDDVRVQEPPRGALRGDRPDLTTEHGKTLDESRGYVRRGIENVEVALRDAVDDDGLRPRGHRARARLRRPPPADGRLRGDRAVQLPGDGPALVSPVRDRDGQHLRREAVRARPALAEAHPRAPRRAASRPAS